MTERDCFRLKHMAMWLVDDATLDESFAAFRSGSCKDLLELRASKAVSAVWLRMAGVRPFPCLSIDDKVGTRNCDVSINGTPSFLV